MESGFNLAARGTQLWTGKRGQAVRQEALAQLATLASGDTLVIDLKNVEVFDFSFANEFFGKLLQQLPVDYPGRFLVVEHLNDDTREDLTQALESLGLVVIERVRKQVRLIGKLHPTDLHTFQAIATAQRPITAAELAEQLGTNPTAMNERLGKLAKLGVVRREKTVSSAGREQYQYTVLQ
jgi:hypothetical protein